MTRFLMIAALLALPATVSAQSKGLELWKEFYLGMSKDEVRQAMPERNIDIATDCRAKIYPKYRDGRLRAITLQARWVMAYNDCADVVLQTLLEKYGPPKGYEINRQDSPVGFKNYAHDDQVFWIVDGNKKVTLAAYPTGRFKFVRYEPFFEPKKEMKTEL